MSHEILGGGTGSSQMGPWGMCRFWEGSWLDLIVEVTKHLALAVGALAKRRVIFAIALEAVAPESMLWEQWHAKHEPEPISCMQL